MAMLDVARVKENIGKMIDQGAPESDLNTYLSHEVQSPADLAAYWHGVDVTGDVPTVRKAIEAKPAKDQEELFNLWAHHYVDAEHAADPIGGTVSDAGRAVARGTFVGMAADRLNAATAAIPRALGMDGPSYSEGLAYQQARDDSFDSKAPVVSTALKVLGGVAGGGAGLLASGAKSLAVRTAGRALGGPLATWRPSATLAGRIGQGMANGAVWGGTGGALATRDGDPTTMLENAGRGAAMGAGIGAAAGPIVEGLQAGGQKLGLLARSISPLRAADIANAQTMDRAGMTPASTRAAFQAGQDATGFYGKDGYLPETLSDIWGDAGQRSLRDAATIPGRGGTIAKQFLTARQAGSRDIYDTSALPKGVAAQQVTMGGRERVLDTMARAMKIKGADTAYQTEKSIVAKQSAQATPLYDKAWKSAEAFDLAPMNAKWMALAAQEEAGTGRMINSMRRMVDHTRRGSQTPNLLGEADDLRRVDSVKRALDQNYEVAIRDGRNNDARYITMFKHDLMDAVHGGDRAAPTLNQGYAAARDAFAGHAAIRNAIKLGRGAFKDGAEITADEAAQLTPSEMKGFRLGLHEALRNKLGEQPTTGDPTVFLRKPNVAAVIKVALPRTTKTTRPGPQLGEIIRRESRMSTTHNMVKFGSPTASIQEGVADIGAVAKFMERLRKQGLVATAADTVKDLVMARLAYRESTARVMAHRLTSTDPAIIEGTLRRIERQSGIAARNEVHRALVGVLRQIGTGAAAGAFAPVVANKQGAR